MIRIWLGPDDLARTRLLPAPLPLHEVFTGLASRSAAATARPGRELRDLTYRGAFPDFLAPLPERADPETLDDGLHRLAGTSPARMRRELVALTGGTLNAWHHSLAAGSRTALRQLTDAVRRHHDRHVAELTADAAPQIRRDARAKSRRMASTGVEGLFTAIHPSVRWHNPVLIVDAPHDLDLRPNGAGLTFVPSVAATRPWVGTDPGAVFITYPVIDAAGPILAGAGASAVSGDPLAALLGRSRAAVLRAVAVLPGTTTSLARRVGISVPSASQHLTVLREAGLVATVRRGNSAHHAVTAVGRVLVGGP